jgi:bloom syndrome protein
VITNAIAACGSDSEDMSTPCQPAAEFALADGATTRTHSYNSIHAREIPMHGTQIIDKDFDGAHISSTSHGSTLASDIPDTASGADIALDCGSRAVTSTSTMSSRSAFSWGDMEGNVPALVTSDSRSSHHHRHPAFAAADEVNDRGEVHHGPASDDELWNYVDGNVQDDNIDAVCPDADQPTPLFSAVAALRPPPAETPSEANFKASRHYPEVVEKLRNVFRLKSFRKNQLAAIVSTLEGRDAVVLMPTGGGKSLCYQLPAVCRGGKTSGVTVVISPLKALMADQVERLHSLKIDVMMLVSRDSQDGNTMHQLRTTPKKPSLLYVTPEKLGCSDNMKAILKGLYARQQLARFVIDEAHLINTWGRDFRASGVRPTFL